MFNKAKRKNFTFLIVLSGIMSFSVNDGLAAPQIDSWSGTVSNGNSITIQGSGFGTKSTAAPLLWENFENGTPGTLLSISNKWTTQIECTKKSSQTGIFSTDKSNSGIKSAKQILFYDAPCWSRTKLGILGNQTKLFVSYNFYVVSGGTGDHTKMGRIGCNNDVHCWPDMGYTAFGPSYYYAFGSQLGEKVLWANTPDESDKWVRDDMWSIQGTSGQANGTNGVWRNGLQKYFSTAVNNNNLNQPYNQFFMPYYNQSGDRTVYIDDVYIDNTLSRVEICPGSTWGNRGKCEFQIPTAWGSDGKSIVITVNQGAFATGSTTRFLYVVDSTGVANSNGKEIIFDGTTASAKPTSPYLEVISYY